MMKKPAVSLLLSLLMLLFCVSCSEPQAPASSASSEASGSSATEVCTHVYGEWTTTLSPTCAEAGMRVCACEKCGETLTAELPATGHSPVGDPAVAASCTVSGKTEGSHCGICGEILTAQKDTAPLGHSFVNGACTRCGAVSVTVETGKMNAEQIYEKCAPAVFYIEVKDASGKTYASGSGFLVSRTGIAFTNFHVIEDAASAVATLSDGTKLDVRGVYDFDEDADWAILQLDGTDLPFLPLVKADPAGGSEVFAIGSPLGLQNSISQGIISNVNRVIDGQRLLQTTASISSGSSGGALINNRGEVVGITCATLVNGQNLNLAVPVTILPGIPEEGVPMSFAGVESARAEAAAKDPAGYLRRFLIANGKFETGDTSAEQMYTIDLADYSGRTLYSLFYLPATGQVMASEIFYTFGASSYLYTEIDLTSPGAAYPASFTYHTRTSETVASLSLPAASLTESSPLPAFPLETSGTQEISESEVREYFRQMLLETLSAVQQVMDSYDLPITLEHFGFCNL